MTDTQILTLAIPLTLAIILPLSLLIYSNTRITDAKDVLRAEMQTLETRMDARFDRLESKIDSHIEHMEMRIKLHEMEHHHPPKA